MALVQSSRLRLSALSVGVAVLASTGTAGAAWGVSGSGTSSAGATALPAPTAVSATCETVDSITVRWTTSATAPIATSFKVERATNGGPWTQVAVVTAVAGTTSYTRTDSALPAGAYAYRVAAARASWSTASAASATRTVSAAITNGPQSGRGPASCT